MNRHAILEFSTESMKDLLRLPAHCKIVAIEWNNHTQNPVIVIESDEFELVDAPVKKVFCLTSTPEDVYPKIPGEIMDV